jgi:hypothetical protein
MADRAVNAEVERLILGFAGQDQSRVYDALILLQQAGSDGLHVQMWARALGALNPQPAMPLLRRVIETFQCCITRVGNTMVYVYAESPTPDFDEFEIDPFEEAATKVQVARVLSALSAMRAKPTFTRADLTSWLLANGEAREDVDEVAESLITNLGVIARDDGSFAIEGEERVTNEGSMAMFRAILADPFAS